MGKHAQWRKIAKKLRRKRIRQFSAKQKYEQQENAKRLREQSPTYITLLEEQKRAEEFQEQEEERLATEREAQWLKTEEAAQKQWQELQKKIEQARFEREKRNEAIRLEWEREQERLQQIRLEKERQAEEKQKQQENLKQKIDDFINNGGDIPDQLKENLESNPGKPFCPFFQKTAACRFKDGCSRNHVRPTVSEIILIPNFYIHYSLEQVDTEYGNDSVLEFENHERYNHFREFFFDVLPEMEKCGHITQFKVCCNHEPHLRGNVYIEYRSCREAIKSYQMFNGRFYGGRQLNVEFCNISSWKSAICGLHFKQRCPKGSACNFLHVFRNPCNLFRDADKDLHRTPSRKKYDDITPDTRNWRWSESPERTNEYRKSHNSHHHRNGENKHKRKRRRSRSRSHSRNKSQSRSKKKKCKSSPK